MTAMAATTERKTVSTAEEEATTTDTMSKTIMTMAEATETHIH